METQISFHFRIKIFFFIFGKSKQHLLWTINISLEKTFVFALWLIQRLKFTSLCTNQPRCLSQCQTRASPSGQMPGHLIFQKKIGLMPCPEGCYFGPIASSPVKLYIRIDDGQPIAPNFNKLKRLMDIDVGLQNVNKKFYQTKLPNLCYVKVIILYHVKLKLM